MTVLKSWLMFGTTTTMPPVHPGHGPVGFSLIHGDPLTDPTVMWRVWRVA